MKRSLDARSGARWVLGRMGVQSKKIRYHRMGGSLMEWDFRQGIGGQSFLSGFGQVGWLLDRSRDRIFSVVDVFMPWKVPTSRESGFSGWLRVFQKVIEVSGLDGNLFPNMDCGFG